MLNEIKFSVQERWALLLAHGRSPWYKVLRVAGSPGMQCFELWEKAGVPGEEQMRTQEEHVSWEQKDLGHYQHASCREP